jgi:hypothetical protein
MSVRYLQAGNFLRMIAYEIPSQISGMELNTWDE